MLWQDWVTISISQSGITVGQNRAHWLDLEGSSDVSVFLDVREQSGGALFFRYETSPSMDDSSFLQYATFNPVVASTPRVDVFRSVSADLPVARFLRWILGSNGTAGDITFRIAAATYRPR